MRVFFFPVQTDSYLKNVADLHPIETNLWGGGGGGGHTHKGGKNETPKGPKERKEKKREGKVWGDGDGLHVWVGAVGGGGGGGGW